LGRRGLLLVQGWIGAVTVLVEWDAVAWNVVVPSVMMVTVPIDHGEKGVDAASSQGTLPSG
jgi:hypothetical protein